MLRALRIETLKNYCYVRSLTHIHGEELFNLPYAASLNPSVPVKERKRPLRVPRYIPQGTAGMPPGGPPRRAI